MRQYEINLLIIYSLPHFARIVRAALLASLSVLERWGFSLEKELSPAHPYCIKSQISYVNWNPDYIESYFDMMLI